MRAVLLLALLAVSNAFTHTPHTRIHRTSVPVSVQSVSVRSQVSRSPLAMAAEDGSASGRRKKSRGKENAKKVNVIRATPVPPPPAPAPAPAPPVPVTMQAEVQAFASTIPTTRAPAPPAPAPPAPAPAPTPTPGYKIEADGSSSLEDLFGLGNNQLRELNEQFLPGTIYYILYYYTTILLYYYTTILLYYYTTILLYYYTTTILLYYYILYSYAWYY
jgi:hypothetical protein